MGVGMGVGMEMGMGRFARVSDERQVIREAEEIKAHTDDSIRMWL